MKNTGRILLNNLRSDALSILQLKDLVGPSNSKNTRWMEYDQLQEFQNLQDLMSLGSVVILLEIEAPRAPKVGHFVILLDHGSHYEHFDSYGLNMDEELKITQEHHLTNIFKNSRKPIVENTVRYQTLREDINTCGRWVVTRFLLKHMELPDFQSAIKASHQDYDNVVALLTMLLPFKK